MNVSHDDRTTCDSEAAKLLPWLVTGRLAPDETAWVEAHVAACAVCAADLEDQRRLHDCLREDARSELPSRPSFERLASRLDEIEREIEPVLDRATAPVATTRVPRWVAAAVALQALGLLTLGSVLWQQSGGPRGAEYRTLSTPAPVGARTPQLRVVFAPRTTVSEVGEMLGAIGATIVEGPSPAGSYALALDASGPGDVGVADGLARLRSDARVLFAEPIQPGGRSPR